MQWGYKGTSGFEAYDPEINYALEKAYQSNNTSVTLDLVGGQVIVNFQQMEERSVAGIINIQRVDLLKGKTKKGVAFHKLNLF